MADPSIGLMDGAYFVGRKEIVDWINNTLGIGIAKVEQTASGAIACQLLDMLFPGEVAMGKVNWMARVDHEFIPNYKVLQNAFDRVGIERHVDVDKLIRGKYQDNLEFMQWFKRFFEMHTPAEDYNAAAVRERGRGGQQFNREFGIGTSRGATTASSRTGAAAGRGARAPAAAGRTTARTAAAPRSAGAARPTAGRTATRPASGSRPAAAARTASADVERAAAEIAELKRENAELKVAVEGLEKERDFYFDKLTDIEELLQGKENDDEWIGKVFEILYATTEDFVPADQLEAEEGEGEGEGEGDDVQGDEPLPEDQDEETF